VGKDDEKIEFDGEVLEALPSATFRVKLDGMDRVVIAKVSGKMRKHYIRILLGDRGQGRVHALRPQPGPYHLPLSARSNRAMSRRLSEDDHLSRISELATERREADEDFRRAVIAAWDAGVPIRLIAHAAGYKSHGTLYQYVKRHGELR
jgi:translation initiation factor IF-1